VLSSITALAVPIGTVIGGYLLYVLLSAKGRRVFCARLRGHRRRDPYIKCRALIAVWIALGLGALLIAVIVAANVLAN
jgi:hypothetical protein